MRKIFRSMVFFTGMGVGIFSVSGEEIFQPGEALVVVDFENLGEGEDITQRDADAWTGNEGAVGATPMMPEVNASKMTLRAPGEERRVLFSNLQTLGASGEVTKLFFSAWIYLEVGGGAGARVQIATDNSVGSSADGKLGGFGIVDVSGNKFAMYVVEPGQQTGTWIQSDTKAESKTWYEVALVVELNREYPEDSVGHLYIRNLTYGETDFTPVPDLMNVPLNWYIEGFTAEDFGYFRVENFRNAQLDNLTVGHAEGQ